MKLPLLSLATFLLISVPGICQHLQPEAFPLSSVRLLDSPFKEAQQTDMRYMLALDPDRLLAPYLTEAGIPPKAANYGNWEDTGLDGHIGGHYLSALSLMYAATGNPELLQRLNYMVSWLDTCQQRSGNGYVGGVPGGRAMWQEIAQGKIDAGSFSLNGKWVPWYNLHKLYAGLRDAYVFAGNEKARDILVKLTDWCINLTAELSEDQMQEMLKSEHGGLNEVFADVAAITGDQKYLRLAQRFSDRSILKPLLARKDELNGLHANTQIPKVIGYLRIAELDKDKSWAGAADFFWNTVVHNRTVSIGGNSVREHFHPANDFSSMVESKEGPETCNTYNMLKLTKSLFLDSAACAYMDYYERAMYNHILSSQHPGKGGFVYFTPMRPRHYRVYSQPQQGFWCCVGSGLENHGKYGELIYAHNDKDLFVNLFIASTLNWQEKGVSLVQHTKFPYQESTDIELKLKKPAKFALHIRHPEWVKAGQLKVRVNGKEMAVSSVPSSYVTVSRKWKSGDKVTVSLPMETKAEYLPDHSPWVSFVHGPMVLAAATDTTDLTGLWADSSRMGHIANGPLYPVEEAPLLVSADSAYAAGVKPVAGQPLVFSAAGIISSDKYKQVKLVPFYQIHDARYMVYWPVTTPAGLDSLRQSMHAADEAKLVLDKATVDQVAPGEQQPESDHKFRGERTEAGIYNDRHWRHASGWFGYELKNTSHEARKLRVTYYGKDQNRNFDILVNGQLVATVNLDGSKGDRFFDVDYDLPKAITSSDPDVLQVKFVAHDGSVAGGIYYIRLLK
ncbi:glycoside hydrolase family 127 protein [Pontibacter sp. 172403-2]|uniref:glycoside hydrolase family 127 protein n=1 Tax=Pontibacter rufus TaxID=2791028 RepID=UPI0018AF5C71|nr:glycoside hydrolase family 127 protein [Pontibacter sp. 172403-2]MBF9255159.1 glycoside hydrolase family 127 protein [Pontibacter sp. 172403-2]